MKPLHIIGAAIVALSLGLGYFSLTQSFRPYTTKIDEAMTTGRSIQLAGFLGSNGAYDPDGKFRFAMKDDTGRLIDVVYNKPKPANFEQAISIVAIGHYDAQTSAFVADDLLVKCPSKYQEMATRS